MKTHQEIKTQRIGIVVKGDLVSGVQFEQATKSGDRLVLVWAPDSDRLYRWDCPTQTWIRIKPDLISADKKRRLAEVVGAAA
jgi:hypothetical protein